MSGAYQIAACDRCSFVTRVPTGYRLPTGWENDPYTGRDLCPECTRRVELERSRERALGEGT